MDEQNARGSWSPGAWTAERCEHWRHLDDESRQAFVMWVYEEGRKGVCHPHQLPAGYDAPHAAA